MRTTTVLLTCDHCGFGSSFSDPRWFVRVEGFDLCRWCAAPEPREWIETGGHRVEFAEDGGSWACSCGQTWRRPGFLFGVMSALPSPANASAHVHLERRD